MKVTMIHSAGEYVAGGEYDLPDELSDRFVILGYADGKLSRDYGPDERMDMYDSQQKVSV